MENNFFKINKNITYAVLIFIAVIVIGIAGYMIIEGWSFFDSAYMTIITIATVGYKEIRPLTGAGRIFTILLIFMSMASLIYIAAAAVFFSLKKDKIADESEYKKRKLDIKSIMSHKLTVALLIFLSVFIIGIVGYMVIEGWSFFDACYMTVITLATVGYGEINTLNAAGRIFTMFLILGGMGVLLYVVSTFTAFFVGGELKDILRRRKMEKSIDSLNEHYILCGAGRTGSVVIEELMATKRNFVVIEKNTELVRKFAEMGCLCMEGNATEDEVLLEAGVKRARGLIAMLSTDSDNLFVVLTAKGLNPNLRVVARIIDESAAVKFKKAGADAVVSPNYIGGLRIISEMVRPQVVSFLDIMMREKEGALRVEDVKIPDSSHTVGKTLAELNIPEKTGLIVLAVKNMNSSTYQFNPTSHKKIEKGDYLIVMGSVDQLAKLRDLIGIKSGTFIL